MGRRALPVLSRLSLHVSSTVDGGVCALVARDENRMSCPICGAKCKCKNAGPGGVCCGCHKHKAQRGMTRAAVDTWRTEHALEPISDKQWRRQFHKREQLSLPFDDQDNAARV